MDHASSDSDCTPVLFGKASITSRKKAKPSTPRGSTSRGSSRGSSPIPTPPSRPPTPPPYTIPSSIPHTLTTNGATTNGNGTANGPTAINTLILTFPAASPPPLSFSGTFQASATATATHLTLLNGWCVSTDIEANRFTINRDTATPVALSVAPITKRLHPHLPPTHRPTVLTPPLTTTLTLTGLFTVHPLHPSHITTPPILLSHLPLPPRLLVYGSKSTGKSTLTRQLVNASISLGGEPVMYLDVDAGQPTFTTPGLLSLSTASTYLSDPLADSRVAAPVCVLAYGDVTSKGNPSNYTRQIAQLASLLPPPDDSSPAPVVIVNTDGWIKSLGLEILNQVISIVSPNTIIKTVGDAGYGSADDGVVVGDECNREVLFRQAGEMSETDAKDVTAEATADTQDATATSPAAPSPANDVSSHLTRFPSAPKDQRLMRLLQHFLGVTASHNVSARKGQNLVVDPAGVEMLQRLPTIKLRLDRVTFVDLCDDSTMASDETTCRIVNAMPVYVMQPSFKMMGIVRGYNGKYVYVAVPVGSLGLLVKGEDVVLGVGKGQFIDAAVPGEQYKEEIVVGGVEGGREMKSRNNIKRKTTK